MLFSFDKLIDKCIHTPFFTNGLDSRKLRNVFSFTSKAFKKYSTYTLQKIKETDPHFHYIREWGKENLINKVLKKTLPRKVISLITNSDVELCQMSLGEEESRMVGILEKINNSQKYPARNFLFAPLFYDFEHSFHPNLKKKKLKESSLICIMSEVDCLYY